MLLWIRDNTCKTNENDDIKKAHNFIMTIMEYQWTVYVSNLESMFPHSENLTHITK